MAITEADLPVPFLPLVRRLEAAGFRAWPSESVVYDGSWQLRLTPGHPSRRLNCLVPLDPQDARDMDDRIDRAIAAFESAGIAAAIRQTPLAPPQLFDVLARKGFAGGDLTLVMTADLDRIDYGSGMDHLPTHDVERFVEACLRIDTARDTRASVLAAIIGRIEPAAGLFLMEGEDGPRAVAMAVQDNDLAGLQQIVVEKGQRGRGIGREIVASALRWAKLRGARQAWLQVAASNEAAIGLYRSIGFSPTYSYSYWCRGR